MSIDSLWNKAVQNHLAADAPLSAAVTGVYDGVAPQAADSGDPSAFPFVMIGDVDLIDYHTATESGFEIVMEIVTISRSPGRKEVLDINALIYTALHRQQASLSVAGHSVLIIDREGSTVDEATDFDGSFEGRCEFRAIVTKDAAD